MYTIISAICTVLVLVFVPVDQGSIIAGAILFVGTLISAQADEYIGKFLKMQATEAPQKKTPGKFCPEDFVAPKSEEERQNIGVLALDLRDFEGFVQGHSSAIITARKWGNPLALKHLPLTSDARAQIVNDGEVIVQYILCDDITKMQGRVFTSVEQTERFHRHPNAIELGRKALERVRK